jgi:hypothetical protein
VTETFKHKKSELVEAGYAPTVTSDALYFNDPQTQTFVQLDRALHERIQAGHVRL